MTITRQKGFALKLQPTVAQLLDPKISISEAPKNVVEEWSQNHALEMFLAGVNKNISQAATVSNYESSMRGARGYHEAYLGHFLINGKKPTPPPKVKVNEHNIAKIEHGILEAYKNMTSPPYSVLKSAFAKKLSISNDGIQKFANELNGVMVRTLDENLNVQNISMGTYNHSWWPHG